MASYDAEAMELRVQLAITAINRSFTSLQTTTNEEGEPVAIMVHRACAMSYGNGDITVVCKHDACANVLATLAHAPEDDDIWQRHQIVSVQKKKKDAERRAHEQ